MREIIGNFEVLWSQDGSWVIVDDGIDAAERPVHSSNALRRACLRAKNLRELLTCYSF